MPRNDPKTIDEAARTLRGMKVQDWTQYTVAWGAAGTAPAIGNGTLTGWYKADYATCLVAVSWLAGSTTTFGTDAYNFSLPFASTSPINMVGSALGMDLSGNRYYPFTAMVAAGAQIFSLYEPTNNIGVTNVNPVVWASGDSIYATILYQITR